MVVPGRIVISVTLGMSASIFTTGLGAAVAHVSRGTRRGERPRSSATPVLVMEGVRSSYGAGGSGCSVVVRVLDGAALRVSAGEVVGIAGDPGAGKSTLLRCAAGIIRPERGRVRWAVDDGHGEAHLPQLLYLDLHGGVARCAIEDALACGVRLVLVDHAASAVLAELRSMLARSRHARGGTLPASAIVVASRRSGDVARVASRVLVLRDGRLVGADTRTSAADILQRNRSAARASSEFPAALARARMRST